jgi:hypothetical protein
MKEKTVTAIVISHGQRYREIHIGIFLDVQKV